MYARLTENEFTIYVQMKIERLVLNIEKNEINRQDSMIHFDIVHMLIIVTMMRKHKINPRPLDDQGRNRTRMK